MHFSQPYLFGSNDSRAVGTDQAALRLTHQGMLNANHIMLRNALSNAHNQWDFGFKGFQDGCSSSWWWHIDHRGISFGRLLCFAYWSEYGQIQMLLASLLWRYTANDFCSIIQCLFAVERALFTSKSLHNDFGIGIQTQVWPCCFIWVESDVCKTQTTWNENTQNRTSTIKQISLKSPFAVVLMETMWPKANPKRSVKLRPHTPTSPTHLPRVCAFCTVHPISKNYIIYLPFTWLNSLDVAAIFFTRFMPRIRNWNELDIFDENDATEISFLAQYLRDNMLYEKEKSCADRIYGRKRSDDWLYNWREVGRAARDTDFSTKLGNVKW